MTLHPDLAYYGMVQATNAGKRELAEWLAESLLRYAQEHPREFTKKQLANIAAVHAAAPPTSLTSPH